MSGAISQAATEISVDERAGTVTVTFVRTGDLSSPVRLTYGVTSDTAEAGIDFVHALTAVDFAPGQARATITIDILNDALSEPTEAFVISLLTADNDTSLSVPRTIRVNILDDENPAPPTPLDPPLTPGFRVETELLIDGLSQPLNIEFSPVNPDIVYVAEKSGLIRVMNIETRQDLAPLIDLRSIVNSSEDRGLMDIAVHPDFANNPYIYAFYVVDPPGVTLDVLANRYAHVVRFTADPETGYTTIVPGSEVILVGGTGRSVADISGNGDLNFSDPVLSYLPSSERFLNPNDSDPPLVIGGFKQDYLKVDSMTHVGGALAFGPDGMLYISTGDGTSPNYADPRSGDVQNLNSLSGKILRVDPLTGQGLTDNPFYEAGQSLDSNQSKVFQLGLRNPFSIGFRNDGQLFITETGWNSFEEINTGGPGANFGWPWYEGRDGDTLAQTPGYNQLPAAAAFYAAVASGEILVTAPFAAFAHAAAEPGFQNQAITGSSFVYDGTIYPEEFIGQYIFTNFTFGRVFIIDTDNRNDIEFLYQSPSTFAPTHFVQGPDGYVYYTDFGPFNGEFTDGSIGRLKIFPLDGPEVTVDQQGIAVEGPNAVARAAFSLSEAQTSDVVVSYSVVDGSAIRGQDYSMPVSSATLIIPAGQTSVTVEIPLLDNAVYEAPETFRIVLQEATRDGIQIAAVDDATIIIRDEDAPPPGTNLLFNGSFESPGIAVGAFSAFGSVPGWTALGGGQIEVWNRHNGVVPTDGNQSLELDYADGRDGFYQDVSTVAGQSYALSFDLLVRPDYPVATQDVEVVWNGVVVATATPGTNWSTFTVNVTGTGGADRLTIREVAAQGSDGLGALLDNFRLIAAGPAVPGVSVSAAPGTVTEGADAFAAVTFSLNAAQASDVTLTYSTTPGTALSPGDFTAATSATAIIPAGATSVTVQIAITDDAAFEPAETFTVNLTGATLNGAPIAASGTATVTIADNDPPPVTVSLSARTGSVVEGEPADALFTLSAAQTEPVAVTFSTVNGTASAPGDFPRANMITVTIPAGATSIIVRIPTFDDALVEPAETFSVSLVSATVNGQPLATSGAAAFTIIDNDAPPAPAGFVLFDDALQNGASFRADGGISKLSDAGDPALGSRSVEIVSAPWAQNGLVRVFTLTPETQVLQVDVYREPDSGGTMIVRHGAGWAATALTAANYGTVWTIDGVDAGTGTASLPAGQWSKVSINLGAIMGEAGTFNAFMIQGDGDGNDRYFLDNATLLPSAGPPAPSAINMFEGTDLMDVPDVPAGDGLEIRLDAPVTASSQSLLFSNPQPEISAPSTAMEIADIPGTDQTGELMFDFSLLTPDTVLSGPRAGPLDWLPIIAPLEQFAGESTPLDWDMPDWQMPDASLHSQDIPGTENLC